MLALKCNLGKSHPKRAIPHCFLEKKGDDSTQPLKGRKKRLDSLTIVGKCEISIREVAFRCWVDDALEAVDTTKYQLLLPWPDTRSAVLQQRGNSSFTPNLYPSCAHLSPLEPRNKLQDTLACCVSASSARVESAALQGCLLWDWIHKSQAKPWYLIHQNQWNEPLPLGIHLVAPCLLQCTARVHECAQHPSHNTLTIIEVSSFWRMYTQTSWGSGCVS